MNQPAYNWAAEVMAYALAHPAGMARRRAPKASRTLRSAPATVQAPTAQPEPEPPAGEPPMAEPEPIEVEPVSQVQPVAIEPPQAGHFTPRDLVAVAECLRLIDRGSEDATEYFLRHLAEIFAVGTTVAKPGSTVPDFDHFVADIRSKMVDHPSAAYFHDAIDQILTAGREYQRTNKAGQGEAELAAQMSRWARFDRGTYTCTNCEGWAKSVEALSQAGVATLGVYVEGSDVPLRIRIDRLKRLLACRKTWVSWSVRIDSTGLLVSYTGRHGNRGHVRLVDSCNAPTVAVSVGPANVQAVAA